MWPIQRNREMREKLFGTRENKGYVKPPLLRIEPECCPPDHLHMRRSLIDRLLNQVIQWALQQDNEHKLLAEMKRIHLPFKYTNIRNVVTLLYTVSNVMLLYFIY